MKKKDFKICVGLVVLLKTNLNYLERRNHKFLASLAKPFNEQFAKLSGNLSDKMSMFICGQLVNRENL